MMERPVVLDGMEALIVDRKSEITPTVKRILEQHGCTVHQVSTGQEAILVHRRRPCDLILVDVEPGSCAGLTDLHNIRTDSHTCILPLVALADQDTGETRWSCISAGADLVLRKPLNPREFVSRTATLLEGIRDIGGRMYSRSSVLESVFGISLKKHDKKRENLMWTVKS